MTKITFVLAAVLALATAPAAAQWYGPGTYEPDTEWDAVPGVMWAGPDTDPSTNVKKVYFNAYQVQEFSGVNPNSGQLGTHFTAPVVHIQALLGIWKDCNGDGYIGLAEMAASEYRAELLLDDSICPAGTSAHNDGQWVYEFTHIGPLNYNETGDAVTAYNVVNGTFDEDVVKVWGDLGLPGGTPGFSCPLNPPVGTTSRTGALLRWGDCSSGNGVAKAVNTVDEDGSLGLHFEDEKNPQDSSSLLNQDLPVNLWGNPYTEQTGLLESGSGDPAFTTWDCAGPALVSQDVDGVEDPVGPVADPTGGEDISLGNEYGYVVNDTTVEVYQPAPGLGNPIGSYVDAANNTETGLIWDCDSEESGTFSEILGFDPEGWLESPGQASSGKNEVNSKFTFWDGQALKDMRATVEGRPIEYGAALAGVLGGNTPQYLGVQAGANALFTPGWQSNTVITSEEFYVSPESGPTDKRYFTFYAYIPAPIISQEGIMLPGGTLTSVYGAENCPDIGEGASPSKGWNCDPTQWYLDNAGNPREAEADSVRVGQEYNLRDVDCFNGLPILPLEEESGWC